MRVAENFEARIRELLSQRHERWQREDEIANGSPADEEDFAVVPIHSLKNRPNRTFNPLASLRGFLEDVSSCWIVSLIVPRASHYAKPNRAAADYEDFAARVTHIQTVPPQRATPGVAAS